MKQHTAVLRSSVFLLAEVSAFLDPLDFKQLHICVIPDRGIHIPERERQEPLYSLWPGTWKSNHSQNSRHWLHRMPPTLRKRKSLAERLSSLSRTLHLQHPTKPELCRKCLPYPLWAVFLLPATASSQTSSTPRLKQSFGAADSPQSLPREQHISIL